MRPQSRFALFAVVVALALAAVLLLRGVASDEPVVVDTAAEESALSRPDARVIGEPGSSSVVFTEFLDFECEACGAAYPIIEDLRDRYAGRVTFVARYFPLPGHVNSERAARAVESAARQGRFEQMYQKMYETQAEWGEGREPLDDLFRSYAVELGLNMETFDVDYASDEVAERVQRDLDDGISLGIQGTPTFFIDQERFEPQSVEDFDQALLDALDQS